MTNHYLRWSGHANCWRVFVPDQPSQYFFEWNRACRFLLHMLKQYPRPGAE
jgi:hypothetical protein